HECLPDLGAAIAGAFLLCDLNPKILILPPKAQLKIPDSGFARRLATRMTTEETKDTEELSAPVRGGTFAYMAPEVLLGKEPDQRSDIFSIGVVLYEALSGKHPFRAGAAPAAGRILQQGPGPIPGAVPVSLRPVITRMLEKEPERRYQTCADVLTDICAVHSGRKPSGVRMRLPLQRIGWLVVAMALLALLI